MLDRMADIAGVLSLLVLLSTLGFAHHQAVAHLRAHLDVLLVWTRGHDGNGWGTADVTPADRLTWMMPNWNVVLNVSGPAISQVTLLGNIAVHPALTPSLVRTAQAVAAFNHALDRYESFKLAMPELLLSVQPKLGGACEAVFGRPGPPPENASQQQVNDVLCRAGLTAEELAYANMLAAMLTTVHLSTIGDVAGTGMSRHVKDLQHGFERFHG